MKTIKLTTEEARVLCDALRDYAGENKELVESARYKIFLEPDDAVYYMDIYDTKTGKKYEPKYENE